MKNNPFFIIDIIIVSFSIIVSIYSFSIEKMNEYNAIFMLPIIFFICYVFFLRSVLYKKYSLYNLIFTIFMFCRYVVMTIGLSKYGICINVGIVSKEMYNTTILLMSYEIVISSITIYILNFKKNTVVEELKEKKVKKKINYVYIFFILFIGILIIIFPQVLNAINFLIIDAKKSYMYNNFNDMENTISLLVVIAKGIIFVYIEMFLSKLQKKNKSKVYYYIALLAMFINIALYYSSNRLEFIITVIASYLIVKEIFKKESIKTLIIGIILIVIAIPVITSSRQMKLVDEKKPILRSITETMQAYMGGIDNVAISIGTAEVFQNERSIDGLIYNLIRPIIGVNMIVKNSNQQLASYYFNYIIFNNYKNQSQIIPVIGQGYFYFGFIFSPILITLFIVVGSNLDKISRETKRVELKYFLYMTIIRLAMISGFNATILINNLSIELIIPMILIYLNYKITIGEKNDSFSYKK